MATSYQLVKEIYRRLAPCYDRVAAPALGLRFQKEAVSYLDLKTGDVVVDVACGTGSNFTFIERFIGDSGHLIGIDLSAEMLHQAHLRVAVNRWSNVTLINSPAEEAQFLTTANAFLFSFAHDVLQSPDALDNLFQYATEGTRVAACGIKWAPWWNFSMNWLIFQIAQRYHTVHTGLEKPWEKLAKFVSDPIINTRAFDTIYVAHGIFKRNHDHISTQKALSY
jgi:ubiquinone/menaquinone biosynthesis C-methylase UbiE